MSRPIITPLTTIALAQSQSQVRNPIASEGLNKTLRSYSISSALSLASSTSSTYSRAPEDLLDRFAAQGNATTIHLWSAGNVRLGNKLDLTIPTRDARELVESIKYDERFELVSLVYLDEDEGDDWKVTFRRTASIAPSSDTE